MKRFLTIIFCLFSFEVLASGASNEGSGPAKHALEPKQFNWTFEGFFGSFDKASSQRGFKVYKEVCSACHGLKRVAYRNLQEIGFGEKEVKYIASQALVTDGPDEYGDMFDRSGKPSDRINGPYANENQARSANGGALPPDLSLIIKARPDGANYVYSLLTGYENAPDNFDLASGKHYNPYFEGRQISMPPPITDDEQILYNDGTYATKEQMVIDVVNFLQWASEPELEDRKKMGIRTMVFLAILLAFMVAAKRIIWRDVK